MAIRRCIIPILLLAGCILFFSFNLGDLSLLKGDENYYFVSALRMVRTGDWITPGYHHRIRFEKPIFYYWLVAIFLKLFGPNWTVARFTSVISGSLVVLFTYLISLRFFSEKKAILPPIILATSFLFFRYSRLAVTDITFLFLVTVSLFLFLIADKENKSGYISLAFLPLGISVMTKGPIGLAVVILTAISYILLTKRYHFVKLHYLTLGIFIFLIITLPWPLIMAKIYKQEYIAHLWNIEVIDKTVGSMLKIKNIDNPILFLIKYLGYYIPVIIFSFAPWGLFLPYGLFLLSKPKLYKKSFIDIKRENRIFVLSWFWSVFILFSIISFKHTHYMLLASPPIAIIVANLFTNRKVVLTIATITTIAYLFLTGFIMPMLDDGTLKVFSLALSGAQKDEVVGIASREFNLKKLGIHLNNLVSDPYQLSADELVRYRRVKKNEVLSFLNSKKRVYCLITKSDYEALIPKHLQNKFYILERNMMWKKIKLKTAISTLLKIGLRGLKQEVYLISNRR